MALLLVRSRWPLCSAETRPLPPPARVNVVLCASAKTVSALNVAAVATLAAIAFVTQHVAKLAAAASRQRPVLPDAAQRNDKRTD